MGIWVLDLKTYHAKSDMPNGRSTSGDENHVVYGHGGRLGLEKIKLGKKCEGCVAIGDFSSQRPHSASIKLDPSVAASMPALLQLWQCMAWPSPQLR